MDPNANLAEQDQVLQNIACVECEGDRERLLELRIALFQWIRDGGFEPNWDKYPMARNGYRRWNRTGWGPR